MASSGASTGDNGIFSTATRITVPREVRRTPRKELLLFSAVIVFMKDLQILCRCGRGTTGAKIASHCSFLAGRRKVG